jgi:hypothetical protein
MHTSQVLPNDFVADFWQMMMMIQHHQSIRRWLLESVTTVPETVAIQMKFQILNQKMDQTAINLPMGHRRMQIAATATRCMMCPLASPSSPAFPSSLFSRSISISSQHLRQERSSNSSSSSSSSSLVPLLRRLSSSANNRNLTSPCQPLPSQLPTARCPARAAELGVPLPILT